MAQEARQRVPGRPALQGARQLDGGAVHALDRIAHRAPGFGAQPPIPRPLRGPRLLKGDAVSYETILADTLDCLAALNEYRDSAVCNPCRADSP